MKKIVKIFLSALIALAASSMVKAQDLPVQNAFICQGDTLRVNDSVAISESGSYVYSLRSVVTGEDSLVRLVVNVYPTFRFEEEIHIQKDSSYLWHGEYYSQTGTYTKTYSTVYECDSIYVLNLIVDSAYTFYETATCCLGDVYEWQGLKISEATAGEYQYKVNYTSKAGTDSTYHLALTIRPKPWVQQVINLCPGEKVSVYGKTYSKAGKDTIVVPAETGCDSTIEVIINQYPSYHFRDTIHIPEDSSYLWHGQVYNQTGTYLVQEKSIYGCDSIYSLTLIVDCTVKTEQSLYFCHGGSITYKDRTYTKQGRDTIVYQSQEGCDSLVILTINEYPTFVYYDTVYIAKGQTIEWHGLDISEAKTYEDAYRTVDGCDSIYYLVAYEKPSYQFYQDTTICFGEVFEWHNQKVSQKEIGTYEYTAAYSSIWGTDSIYHLTVTIQPEYWTIKQLSICDGMNVSFNGKTYTQSGRDTLYYTSVLGCDSVVEVIINAQTPLYFKDTIQLEEGTSLDWRGKTITDGGTYTDEYGCDSVFMLYVQMVHVDHFYQTVSICEGDVYTWEGKDYTLPGDYTASYKNMAGNDSIMHLHLTVNPKPWVIEYLTLCQGSTLEYNGKTYTHAGRDTITFTSSLGCDSIVEVIVKEGYPFYHYDTIQLEAGKTTEWHGQTLSAGGSYTDEHKTTSGCDSIYEVYVQLYYVDHIYKDTTICYGESYTWQGETFSESGEYTREKVFKNVVGTDSIQHLHLIILPKYWTIKNLTICQGNSVTYNGKTYTTAGHDTILFTSSHTCDSVVEVIVTEAYPFYHYDTLQLEAGKTIDWHGQTLSKGGSYEDAYTTIAGCDSIYYLYVEVVCTQTWTLKYLTLCQGETIEYNDKTYSQSGRDTLTLTSSLGCDSIVEVIVTEVYPFHHYDTLQLEAGTSLEWRGQTITEGGTYTDGYTTTSGCDSIYEVYVQVYYVDHIYKDTTICYGETYTWQGETFTESGEYTREKAFKNVAGTDSIMHLHLTILPKYWTVQNLTFCHDKSITFNGKTYTKPGRDTVIMTSSTGCDSIIELIINEAPIYAFYDTITIWDTETYEWVGHGQTITGSGEYKDEHISSGGCDSTYYLKVYVQHKDDIYETATICYGDSIVWQGNTYKEVGVHNYEVTYTNQYGNDSTMHLHLTVLPKYWQQQALFFCHGTSVSYNGKTYNQEGKDTIYYNSINGCDSIVELIIKEYPTYLYQDTVHLQQGKELSWHGQTITQGGVYEDKQTSIYGCDSTYVLLVIEDKVYAFHEKANACVNQTFEWQGLQINEKEAGVYTYNVNYTTLQGADSTYYLELTVYPSYFEQKQFFICRGETITFNNHVYSQPGRDTIRLISATGCDSLIEVIIDEYPSYNFNQTVHIRKDSSYTWNGKVLTQTGSYSQTFTTVNGCDSTYTLTLIVDSAYTFHDTAVSCLGDVFEWQGLKISEAAAGQYNYKVNYSSQYGMDSTYYLSLTIRTKPWSQRILYVCPGENVTFNNKNYSKAGRDTITLPAENGCDSVIEVVVVEYPSYRYNDTVHIKKDSVYTWRGQEYSQTGTYIVQDKTIYGCDSTYTLTLIVDSAYTFYEKADMCLGEIYEWHGLKISEDTAGVYTFTKPYTSIYGMDSVYHLTLEVHEIYKSQKQIFFCASDSVSFLGKVYSKEGKDTIHLQSIYGCDSIVEVLINEYPTYHFQETRIIKGDTSFVWQGKTITDAGVYDAHYSTINGCDSTYTLTVIKVINYEYWERAHICVDETFSWQGLEINEKAAGTYEYRKAYVSQYNTDSIYHLTLTVDTSYVQYQYLSFCEGSYVTFGDSTYTTSGTDTLRYQAVGGCDSTIIVIITEQKRYFSSDTIVLNNQQTFLWHGQTITQSGTYQDVRPTAAGCDSIYELVAIFHPTYLFEDSVAICKCEAPYIWKLNDTTEIELNHDAGLTRRYEQRYESVHHTDSIYRIILTILPEYEQTIPLEICNDGSYYEFFGKHYSEPGTYTDTLKTIHGCDSIIHIQLNVLPQYIKVDTAYLSESHPTYTWSVNDSTFTEPTVYAINEKTIAGCDSINRLVLLQALRYEFPIEHDTLCSSGHDAIIWHNQTLTESGIYYDSLFTVLGEDSIYSIQLAVFPTYDTTFSVTICEEDGPYLFNERIKCYETGTYTDTLQTIHGCDSVVRLELNVLPRVTLQVFDTICETDLVGGYFFHGAVYYNEGTYSRPMQTENQCNSVAELFLRLRPDLSESDSVVICAGETYVLGRAHDPAISEQYNGISVQPMKDTIIWGCDGIHYFRIIVRNEKDTTVNMCENDSLWLPGTKRWVFAEPNAVYIDTIKTDPLDRSLNPDSVHCDSIVRWTIGSIYPTYHPDTIVKHISDHDSILWAGQWRTSTGIYVDSAKTVECGCDSFLILKLIVDKTYLFRDSIHICQPHDVAYQHEWADGHIQSQAIWNEGIYVDSLRSSATADLYEFYHRDYKDSIYTLVVTMDPSYFFQQEYTLCQGDSVQLAGQWITKAGVYTDSLTTAKGCDSIYQYVVNMTQSYYYRETKSIAQGTIVKWHGRDLEIPGVYYDSLKAVTGCDSIYELTLNVYPIYHFITDTTICECQTPYLWHDQMIYESGTYFDKHQTIHHFDSIYELRIQVKDTSHVRFEAATCKGDSLFFDGQWLTQSGVYYDTIKNSLGCDSIIELVYIHRNSYLFEQTAQTDDQHPYIWSGHKDEDGNDMVFTTSGLYQDRQKTYDGCDSIYQLTLTVYPTYRDTLKQHICNNDSLLWQGNYYYTTGIYTEAYKTVAGYDSILVLDLTVLPISETRVNAYTCEGDSVFFDGRWITQEGTYYDTLVNVLGCDSIVEFVYTHKNSYLFEQTAQTDDQHPYIWSGHKDEDGNDMVFTASGFYQDKQKTIDGCDSIYQLTLTVYPTYRDTIREHICDDDSILWRGNYYKISGVYTDALKTVAGYDSIFVLDLTVVPISQVRVNASTCEGDSVFFDERWITQEGTYYDTLVNHFGCDSIIEFVYTHKNTYLFEQTAQTDDQHPYIWTGHKDEDGNDMVFTTSGLYQDKHKTIDGCDSIYRLSLIVYPTYRDTLKETICGNDRFFWRGNYYYTAGTYTDALKTVAGYDSIFVLELTVLPIRYGYREIEICQDDSVTINGQVIIANKLLIGEDSGTNLYYDTLSCDSVVITHLIILPKYFFVETRTISEDSLPFTWHGQSLEMAGTYYDYNKTVTGCDSTYELHLTVSKVADYTFEICQTELPYTLPSGKLINAAGIYPDTIRDSKGQDSLIYKYRVIVNPVLRGEMSVSICEGDFFLWNGDSLRVGGNHVDTLSSPVTGCDSIVTLHLFVKESYLTQINRTIYAGDSVIFEGDTLWHSGQYEKRYSTVDSVHCDSVIQLNLIVKPVFYRDTTVYACESDLPYRWNRYNNEAFYASGTYVRTHVTDSAKFVDTLHLFVDEPQNITIKTNICQGDTLRYRGDIYTQSGVFYDTILSSRGCDTIITIVLNVYPITENHITVNISEDEKYSFGETIIDTIPIIVDGRDTFRLDTIHETRILYKPGTYYDYNKNIYGCDSITVLTLVVHKAKKDSLNVEVCSNELPYIFNGRPLFDSGFYSDSLRTKEGYDSVVVLNLKVHQSYLIEEMYTFEEGTTTRIHGVDISKDTIYYDTLRTIHGCDSVYKIIVNYPRLMEKTINVEACQEGYEFHGELYKKSGTYYVKDKDTSWTINVKIHETQYTRINQYLCWDSDSLYYYNGKELRAPINNYRDTFKTSYGCDSIVIINVGITQNCTWARSPLCKGDTVIILGDTICHPGDYEFAYKSHTGKNDSIVRVNFYEAPFYDRNVQATICQGDSLVFYGRKDAKGNRDSVVVKRAGKQDIEFKTVEGCDSIIHLDLTVNPSYSFVNKAVTVDYLPYTWARDGKTYSVTGKYDYVLPTIHNCDSTFILDLEVIETQRPVQKEQICIGDTIMWRNKKYFATGIYTDTICDIPSRTSIIYSLDLTVVYPTRIDTAYIPVQEVCADANELVVKLNWSGTKPKKYNISFDARARHEGFRDTMNAPFNSLDSTISISIPQFNIPANAEHMRYLRPDKYTMSIILDNGICGQSKAENLQFLIRYPSWILEQRWENVVAVLAKDYNGGYEFSQYEWFVNGAPMPDKIPYMRYADYTFTAGDEVVAYLTRTGENYSVPTCPLVIQMPNPDTNPTPRLLITPTSSSLGNGAPRVMIKSEDTGHYTIFSMMGQPITQGQFQNGETTIDLPAVVGHYIISATQNDGVHTAQKVMVY
ncbi:MAG: hypothetical protein MJZ84_03255 [Paludibacteraceae bacterium]|nr:hypothetical protein [Paludibacteraceae bacterium]